MLYNKTKYYIIKQNFRQWNKVLYNETKCYTIKPNFI